MIDASRLTYEQACEIAKVPVNRGYVTLSEVLEQVNEMFGTKFVVSDQVGLVQDNEMLKWQLDTDNGALRDL